MPSGVDKRQLEKLIKLLQEASSENLRGLYHRVKVRAAAAALTELQLGFRESRDPYGRPWAPLKYRKGKPLLKTARMRNSFTVRITPTGFRIGTNVAYAEFHQRGTQGRKAAMTRFMAAGKNGRFISHAKAGARKAGSVSVRALNFKAGTGGIPKRQMVPEGDPGPIWGKAIEGAVARTVNDTFKGR